MLKDKSLKYRELRRLLSRHGVYEVAHRGKGSHRLFVCDDVQGRKISYPVACHNENHQIHSYIVCRIRETLREKFKAEHKKSLERLLQESYKKSAQEDAALAKDWGVTSMDGID